MLNSKTSSGRLGAVQGINHDQDTTDIFSVIAWNGVRLNLCTQPRANLDQHCKFNCSAASVYAIRY